MAAGRRARTRKAAWNTSAASGPRPRARRAAPRTSGPRPAAVGAESQHENHAAVTGEPAVLIAGRCVPDVDGAGVADGRQPAAVWREHRLIDSVSVAGEALGDRPGGRVGED